MDYVSYYQVYAKKYNLSIIDHSAHSFESTPEMTPDPDITPRPAEGLEACNAGIETFAPYLMNRILRRYNARMDAKVRTDGLNVPRLRVLAALALEGPQTINNLAIYAISEQSSISRLLDQMADEGLVSRQTSEADNRVRIASLTEHGRALYHKAFPLMRAAEADMMAGFSAAEQALATEFLRRILHNVRETPI